jgi:putative transposase
MYILPNRKTPAKGVHVDPDKPTILWVTVCSKNRVEWMAQEPVKRILHAVWLNEATAWLVGDYLLMPDHAHFFCDLRDSRFAVERWGAFWKDRFAKRHCEETWIWQRWRFIIAFVRFRNIVRNGLT